MQPLEEEFFLGREDEQREFREILHLLLYPKERKWFFKRIENRQETPFVFLISGLGGIGKSRLVDRFIQITHEEKEFKNRFELVKFDWEDRKDHDTNLLKSRQQITAEIVFENIYNVFDDKQQTKNFANYQTILGEIRKAEQAAQKILLSETKDQPKIISSLKEKGPKIITTLIKMLSKDKTDGEFDEDTESLVELAAEVGLGGVLELNEEFRKIIIKFVSQHEYNLLINREDALAKEIGRSLEKSAKQKPLIIIFDTYEIVENADRIIRAAIDYAGPRVFWVIAGRSDLGNDRQSQGQLLPGYEKKFGGTLRQARLEKFDIDKITGYFGKIAPEFPLKSGEAEEILRATLGIPLAVRQAAKIWQVTNFQNKNGLEAITGNLAKIPSEKDIVSVMTERFLIYCVGDPLDKSRLYALALAYKPEPDLIREMFQTQELEKGLLELEQRYSMVMVSSMRLHEDVSIYLKKYLLPRLRRTEEPTKSILERAVQYLSRTRNTLENKLGTLKKRINNDEWVSNTLALVYHNFWKNEYNGWVTFYSALIGGLGYGENEFCQKLLDVIENCELLLDETGKKKLEVINSAVKAFLKQEIAKDSVEQFRLLLKNITEMIGEDLLSDIEANNERKIILAFLEGRLAYAEKKYSLALEKGDEAYIKYKEQEAKLQEFGSVLNVLYKNIGRVLTKSIDENEEFKDKAVSALEKALELNSKDANTNYLNGKLYEELGKPEVALVYYLESVKYNKRDFDNWVSLVEVYEKLGNKQRVEEACRDAVKEVPIYIWDYINRAKLFLKLKKVDNAIKDFTKIITEMPKFPFGYFARGNLYINIRNYDLALNDINTAIDLDPKMAEFYQARSIIYRFKEKYDLALNDINTAIDLDPNQASLYQTRSITYTHKQEYDLALNDINTAIDLNPKMADLYQTKSIIYRDKEEYHLALNDINTAIDLDPKMASLYQTRGNIYLQKQEYDLALNDINTAIDLDPKMANFFRHRSNIYRHKREYNQALNDINTAIDLDSNNSGYYYDRGLIALSIQEKGNGLKDFKKANELKQTEVLYKFMIGWVSWGIKRPNIETLDLAQDDFSLRYDRYGHLVILGFLLGFERKWQDGLEALEKAIAFSSDQWGAYFWQGMILAYTRKYKEAEEAIKTSIEKGLPTILLMPLYWFKNERTQFFNEYALPILIEAGLEN